MEYMLTFHILNVYVDKTQPRQFKFTFKDKVEVQYFSTDWFKYVWNYNKCMYMYVPLFSTIWSSLHAKPDICNLLHTDKN